MYKFILISLFILFKQSSALYFYIGETERKCFIEEIPDETQVIVIYKVELYDPRSASFMPSSTQIAMHFEVRGPTDQIIISRKYRNEGKLVFISAIPGDHVICMYSNSTARHSGLQLRVHLDILVGEHAINYGDVRKEKLSEMQVRIIQLLNQVEQISQEQNYQRYREERFRQTSESINTSVLYWPIAQTILLLIMTAWQMKHLKSVLDARKYEYLQQITEDLR